jgi:hypothetical protein
MTTDYKTVTVHRGTRGRLPDRGKGRGRRRLIFPALLLACLFPKVGDAQILDIISIINAAVKKVIVAADLEIEKLQTETIGFQNTEKELENDMEQSELSGIAEWVQDQRDLFSEYYTELWQVKNALDTYEQVRAMINKEAAIVSGFKQAYGVLSKDTHFTPAELTNMYNVLSGIASQSAQNLERLTMVITTLVTQMDDAGRLRIIDDTGAAIDKNYSDLAQFSQQSFLQSIQRSKDANDIAATRALYGISN